MTDTPHNDADITHSVNETADKIKVDLNLRRGNDTRNRDDVKLRVKGDDADDVVEELDSLVSKIEGADGIAQRLRDIQPDE
jgi:hypothetical protein